MEKLFKNGFHIGKVNEIVDDLEKLNQLSDELIVLSQEKHKYYTYRHNIDKFDPDIKNNLELWEIPERKQFVKDNNLGVFQQWYEVSHDHKGELIHIRDYFRNIAFNTVSKIYSELNAANIHHIDTFTIFEDGDFIANHTDGKNPGRLCVILIYLSDSKNYNDGGGEFCIVDSGTNQVVEKVIPVRGNYVLLDFTKNNVQHSVEVVKNNFKRFCYVDFVYNSKKRDLN